MKFYNIKILFKNSFEKKYKILIYLIILIISVVLDFFSLATIAPLISIIINNSIIESVYQDERFYLISKYILKEDFLKYLFIVTVLVFLLRTFSLFLVLLIKNKIITNIEKKLNKKIYRLFISRLSFIKRLPYKEKNKILQVDIQQSISYLNHFFSLLTEILLVISVLIVVIITNYNIALFSIAIFLLIFLLFRALDKFNFSKIGQEYNEIESKRNSFVIESLLGVKDIIIVNKESFFVKKFDKINLFRAEIKSKYLTYSQSIRYALELLTFSIVIILLLLFQGESDIIPILVALAAATVKLIPSINKIIDSIQQIKYFTPSLLKVTDVLSELKWNEFKKVEVKTSINFENILFGYNDEIIFEDLNWKIDISEYNGLRGASGSGKTSLINLLFGFEKPKSGQIRLEDSTIVSDKVISNIGYVPQKVSLIDGSFAQNIAFGEKEINYDRLKRVIIECELDSLINENNYDIHVKEFENELSGGQIQRIGIARALYFEPAFLILDESLNSLDSETSKKIQGSLIDINKKIGLLIISHDPDDFIYCNKIYKIENGKIIDF
jgi:ABC-type multidrug transport system fused ATPase/permease subunit